MFQGMAQLAVAATRGTNKAPPEVELQDMLAEDWEDPRANQFLTWATGSCWRVKIWTHQNCWISAARLLS